MVLHLKVDYVSVCVQLVGRQIVTILREYMCLHVCLWRGWGIYYVNVYRYVLYEYISLLIVVFSATFLFWKELVLFQLFFFLNLLWHFQLLESLKNRFNRQQKLTLFPSLVLAALCMCNTAHSITYVAQDPFCRLVLSEYVINVLFFTYKFRSPLE